MASRIMDLFRRSLQKRPVLTNTVVFSTFYAAAEFSQQHFNKYTSVEKIDIDYEAAGRLILVGSTIYAPTLYYWYKFLERRFPGTVLKSVIAKVACDQFIMTPCLIVTFYTLLGILEGQKDIFAELKEKYAKTFVLNQAFWIPTQTVNFSFMPLQYRVVYVACASFIWINILCSIKRQKVETK